MKKIICNIFGHSPKDIKLIFNSDNKDNKKQWQTYSAYCKRCNCRLFAIKQYGLYSENHVMSKFIEI